MTSFHRTYLIILMCLLSFWVQAQTQYVFQSESPIANYAWDENDTSRYEGHFRFENAYQLIEDMLTDKRPIDFGEAVFAVENCMFDGNLNHESYIAELERISTGIQNMVASPAMTAPSLDMALNYAIFIFYTQPCPLNNDSLAKQVKKIKNQEFLHFVFEIFAYIKIKHYLCGKNSKCVGNFTKIANNRHDF